MGESANSLLFVVVHTANTRQALVRRLLPYFDDYSVCSTAEGGLAWLDRNLAATLPRLAVVEWNTEPRGHLEEVICQRLLRQPGSLSLLVICPDRLESFCITASLRPVGGLFKVISPDDLSLADLPSLVGLVNHEYFIKCGKLMLWPAQGRVLNGYATQQELNPEEWGYVKLGDLGTRVLQYLMTEAQGYPNRKRARDIIDATWAGRPGGSYSEGSAHEAIQRLRKTIEVDPNNPVIICSQRGRGQGYWISTE